MNIFDDPDALRDFLNPGKHPNLPLATHVVVLPYPQRLSPVRDFLELIQDSENVASSEEPACWVAAGKKQ